MDTSLCRVAKIRVREFLRAHIRKARTVLRSGRHRVPYRCGRCCCHDILFETLCCVRVRSACDRVNKLQDTRSKDGPSTFSFFFFFFYYRPLRPAFRAGYLRTVYLSYGFVFSFTIGFGIFIANLYVGIVVLYLHRL